MSKTGLKNDRLWQAVTVLATDEEDVRKRVALACRILIPIHEKELPPELWNKLKKVIGKASSHGSLLNHKGDVVKDPFDNTRRRARKKTFKKYAEEIFSIWKELNGIS